MSGSTSVLCSGSEFFSFSLASLPLADLLPPQFSSCSFENNSTNDPSVELSLDEVKALCAEIGFVIKVRPSRSSRFSSLRVPLLRKLTSSGICFVCAQEEKTISTTYTGSGGMLKYEYQVCLSRLPLFDAEFLVR